MSLVGSLEDLGLGDILQIISLSRKSGVLWLRSEHGEGQILFRDGRVTGAVCKGGPTDLGAVLVASGAVSEGAFADALGQARALGESLESVLAERCGIQPERLDALRHAAVERAAFTMFGWPTGEFSFDVREDVDGIDPALCVAHGIDAQYLAMEGARLRDEASRDLPERAASPSDPTSFAGLFDEEVPAPAAVAEEAMALAEATPEEEEDILELEAVAEVVDDEEEKPEPAPLPRALGSSTPVVLLDPSLPVLEWAKRALASEHERVHVFQKTDLAIARIRQYLVRREVPVVILSDASPPDPNSGARTPAEIARRLRAQAPRMPILFLAEAPLPPAPAGSDAAVARPSAGDLRQPRRADAVQELGRALCLEVAARSAGTEGNRGRASDLSRLKEVSAQIREGVARGEIIPLVMRFAAEHFARVALFLVRDEQAVGIAQLGLARAGGPDDARLREVEIGAREPAWFRAVFDRRTAVKAAPQDGGDRRLAGLLGDRLPPEAYVAPLESGDRVVALLYADNLPAGAPLGEAAGLEVVLHEAGLALDRVALERQLAEAQSSD